MAHRNILIFRVTVSQMSLRLVFCCQDVKCSGNWMWAAKLPGEGALLYDTCVAMCDLMGSLGVAVDGGKDSLSMTARLGSDVVKAPGLCSFLLRRVFGIKISFTQF